MAPSDDEFICLRKAYRDLRKVHARLAQSGRDDIMKAYLVFKSVLLDAVEEMKRTNDL